MKMLSFHDLPIRQRLLHVSLLSAASALLLASMTFVTYDYIVFRETLSSRLLAFADIIGYNSASAILFNDAASAARNLEALKARPGVVAAAVYTSKGALFAQWSDPALNFKWPAGSAGSDDVHEFHPGLVEVFHPIITDNARVGTVFIASDLRERDKRLERYLLIAVFVMVFSFILAAAVARELGWRISQPILDLVKVARKVSVDKEYSVRAMVSAGGEIGLLVETFNYMLAQIQQRGLALQSANDVLEQKVIERTEALKLREEELQQSRRLESVGRLAGGMAHDFNNLLTGIIGCSETLEEEIGADNALGIEVREIKDAAERASSLTKQLLAFSRKQIISPQPLNLNTSVSSLEKILKRLIGEDVELIINLDPKLGKINADPVQIDQIIINIAVNSRDAMPKGGKLFIRTGSLKLDPGAEHLELKEGDYIMLTITDTGTGMTPDVQAKIFEPFFTTKEQGKGTGLGLATVYGAVKQNGGAIQVYSHLDMGTTFKIFLPRLPGDADDSPENISANAEDEIVPMAKAHETILVVEDEKLVSNHISRLLRRQGYEVLIAGTGKEALEVLARHQGTVDLVLTDIIMPEMNGRELADKLKETHPEIRVLCMSGYPAEIIARHGVLEAGIAFIEKPFHSSALCQKIRDVLDA